MSLRRELSSTAILLAVLGLTVALGLVTTTSLLRGRTDTLVLTVESIRAAEDFALHLLNHDRERRLLAETSDPRHGEEMALAERRIADALQRVGEHVTSEPEGRVYDAARVRTQQYLDAVREEVDETRPLRRVRLDAVLNLADRLVELNLEQAQAARDSAHQLDRIANYLGLAVTIGFLLAVVIVLVGMRARVYRPLMGIRGAISAYRSGEKQARAPENGSDELRMIAAEFNEMADALGDQAQRQIRFLAGVAHDLRNPLHLLKLTAQGLARVTPLPPEERIRQSLNRISEQADRLNRMVDDLLDRTRIEAGNLELRLEEVDLRQLVASSVEFHRPHSERHTFELELPEAAVWIRADPLRIEQVLTNLFSNAVKYSPSGGRVRVALRERERRALLSVADEGIGIPSEEIGRIFEPFARSKSSRDIIPGVGLGLSVARKIVQAHGGEIEASSTSGEGAVFRVSFPVISPTGV